MNDNLSSNTGTNFLELDNKIKTIQSQIDEI